MKQAIAGVAPPEQGEVTVMTVWPSNAAYPVGKFLGQLYGIDVGIYPVTLGHMIALASIPLAILIFFWRLLPYVGTRYRLTNRRLVVERGIMGVAERSVELDRFDSIEVVVQPGQEWYNAGDLIFRLGTTETFRLAGVSRPEAFRAACIKSHMAFVGVKKALQRQPAAV